MAHRISEKQRAGDAVKVAKATAALPQSYRTAIKWHYVKTVSLQRACQALTGNDAWLGKAGPKGLPTCSSTSRCDITELGDGRHKPATIFGHLAPTVERNKSTH